MFVGSMSYVLEVTTPAGECLVIEEVLCACDLFIGGHVLPVDLVELQVWDFDVIFGIDWLSPYYALMDVVGRRLHLIYLYAYFSVKSPMKYYVHVMCMFVIMCYLLIR